MQEVHHEGQRLFAVRLPGTPEDQGLLLSEEALVIAGFFDGQRDLRAVQLDLHRQYDQLLYCEKIHELALALWRAGLLEGTERKAPAELEDKVPRRAPLHAGSAYEAEPGPLREMLDATFTHPDGPGANPSGQGRRIVGIVSPHIDLHRGGAVYAHAYKALVEGTDADLFVVFGTAHQSPEALFTLTRADYDTPLGPVKTDRDALSQLASALGDEIFRDEAVHDEEHSIEFQALYLRHLFPEREISILPVLCSSLYGCASPEEEPAFTRFLDALARAVEGRRVCFIAAADLSHVGLVYGDALTPSPADLKALEEKDRESLARLARGDAGAFFNHVVPDAASRRICGLTPIYAAMRASGATGATLLRYEQWFGADEGSAVTFAAATLEAP